MEVGCDVCSTDDHHLEPDHTWRDEDKVKVLWESQTMSIDEYHMARE